MTNVVSLLLQFACAIVMSLLAPQAQLWRLEVASQEDSDSLS